FRARQSMAWLPVGLSLRCSRISIHHALRADLAPDKILPYFMTPSFPSGAVGLVNAAILAASLSIIDSVINACTSVLVIDVYQRFVRPRDGAAADDRP